MWADQHTNWLMVSGHSMGLDRFLCDADEHYFQDSKIRGGLDPFIKPNKMIPQYNELPKNRENVFVITGIR